MSNSSIDSLFIAQTRVIETKKTNAEVDSLNYSVMEKAKEQQTKSTAKQPAPTPKPKPKQTTSKSAASASKGQTQKNSQKDQKKVAPQEISFNSKQTEFGGTVRGHFTTNIPQFDSANIQNKPPCANANGVNIYTTAKDDIENPSVKALELEPGLFAISFNGSNLVACIPKQTNPQDAMIVYNPETKTMCFEHVEGFKILLTNRNSGKEGMQGGENILINGGSVEELNLAEVKDGKAMDNYSSQVLVLSDTTVKKIDTLRDMFLTIGNTVIENVNNHPETIDKEASTCTYHAGDGKATISFARNGNGNGQDYYTVAQFMNWLADGKPTSYIATKDNLGSVYIKNGITDIDIKNAPVSRHYNGAEIYISNGDSKEILNTSDITTGNIGYMDFNGTKIHLPKQPEGNNARIFYDMKTQTLVFENIEGLEINYSEKQNCKSRNRGEGLEQSPENAVSARIYLKNCKCKTLNFEEKYFKENIKHKPVSKLANPEDAAKTRTNIVIDATTTIDDLRLNTDTIYVEDGAQINNYRGYYVEFGSASNATIQHLKEINRTDDAFDSYQWHYHLDY